MVDRLPVRSPAPLVFALMAALALGCGSDDPPLPADAGAEIFRIQARQDSVNIRPNESRQIVVGLTDLAGKPAPNRILQFAIANPAAARGAALSVDRAITNEKGEVTLQVIAGEATQFLLRVTAARAADLQLVVFVDAASHGAVEVAAEVSPGEDVREAIATLRLFFLTDTNCAAVMTAMPEPGIFPVRTLGLGATSTYYSVSTEEQHAVVGHGLDATGVVRVDGCVDVPGRAVLPQETVRVPLILRPSSLVLAGTYRASSVFSFRTLPIAATAVADAWKELSACPNDPARLILDCTVDGLSTTMPDDPLDCRPTATDERAFDGRLAARRGLPMMTGARCRAAMDGAGRPSLESQIDALFGQAPLTTRAPILAHLPALGREATDLLKTFKLNSLLEVARSGTPAYYQLEHRLQSLEVSVGNERVVVDLLNRGLPVRVARFVHARLQKRELTIDSHAFTLRLGTAARAALEEGSLARRKLPASAPGFVTTLLSAATHGGRTGCNAISAFTCALLNEPESCLVQACTAGAQALGERLDAPFALLDGEELDLLLEGSATVMDRDGDRRADALGDLAPNPMAQGVWAGEVRTRTGQSAVWAVWAADRTP